MAAVTGIHGKTLDITVVECRKLKNTEWFSRQDPYVRLDYSTTKHRTKTCTDGGKNPTFGEKFTITLVEGVHEIDVVVWNSNTFERDDFIGSGRALLNRVLCYGYEDATVPIVTKSGRYAGEVKLIMHYGNAMDTISTEARPPHPHTFGHVPPHVYTPPIPYTPPAPSPYFSYPPSPSYPPPAYHPQGCPPSPGYAPGGPPGIPPPAYTSWGQPGIPPPGYLPGGPSGNPPPGSFPW